MTRTSTLAVALTLAACGPEAPHAGEAQLLVPEGYEIGWDDSFNGRDDGLALLVPIDLMVYAPSGEPVEGAALSLTGASGALLVGPDAIVSLGADDPRPGWWDAWRDRYVAFAPGEEPVASLEVETDATGLARCWAFVDAFPVERGHMLPAHVVVALDGAEDAVVLVPR